MDRELAAGTRPPQNGALRLLSAFSCVAGLWLQAPSALASSPAMECSAPGRAVARGSSACQYGLPAVIGRVLLLPKACRIPMDGGAVDRHTIELRDSKTGKKRGQTSLAASPAQKGTPAPTVGALIAGAYPLYVFAGGIAAVDPGRRKAELVLQSEGRLLGATRFGEVLAVADRIVAAAPTKGGKTGSAVATEWTVVDFGSGEMLGVARLKGDIVEGMGFTKSSAALTAWLRRSHAGKSAELVAKVRDKAGKATQKGGQLAAKGQPAAATSASALPLTVGKNQVAVFSSADTVLIAKPPVVVIAGTVTTYATAKQRLAKAVALPDLRAVVGAGAGRPHFGWFAATAGKGMATLRPIQCVAHGSGATTTPGSATPAKPGPAKRAARPTK